MKEKIFNPDNLDSIENWKNNSDNLADYSDKTNPNYKTDNDRIRNSIFIHKTNWEHESDYHNTYRINGKNVKGRTIKLKK